jgi:hypothetical protein
MTLLLIGSFVWVWICMQACEWIYDRTYSLATSSTGATVLFFLPAALFFDFVRIMK